MIAYIQILGPQLIQGIYGKEGEIYDELIPSDVTKLILNDLYSYCLYLVLCSFCLLLQKQNIYLNINHAIRVDAAGEEDNGSKGYNEKNNDANG